MQPPILVEGQKQQHERQRKNYYVKMCTSSNYGLLTGNHLSTEVFQQQTYSTATTTAQTLYSHWLHAPTPFT